MVREQVVRMETELAKSGRSVDELCQGAGVARSTWSRWKNGTRQPNFGTWEKVQSAFAKLTKPEDEGNRKGCAA